VIVLIIFVLAGYYAYNTFYSKVENKKESGYSDVANANMNVGEIMIYFFHVDWCPHCRTSLPEWTKFKNEYHKKKMGRYIIKCIDVNCTDETSEVTALINKYNIEGYPTVKMLKDDNIIEFDSKITYSALEQFVNTMVE
jgi:thiol-disulfide isomerase/thioredoxin